MLVWNTQFSSVTNGKMNCEVCCTEALLLKCHLFGCESFQPLVKGGFFLFFLPPPCPRKGLIRCGVIFIKEQLHSVAGFHSWVTFQVLSD